MSKIKRIIHVENYFDPAAGYQVNELIKIQNENFEQIVIASKDMSPFHKEYNIRDDIYAERLYKIKIIRLDSILKLSSRILLKGLWRTIDLLNPYIVFLHGIGDFKDLVLFGRKKKYLILRDCHMSWVGSVNRFNKLYLKIFSLFFSPIINNTSKYSRVFALGLEEYEYLKAMGIKSNKIDFLLHGYNKKYFFFDEIERKKIRDELSIEVNKVLITYIGKFDKNKRPDLIFDIVTEDLIQNNSIKLLFIGPKNNEYMTNVFLPRLSRYRFSDGVIILPSQNYNNLRAFYSASDICIWPKETTLSSIHAQICKTTVIMENHLSNRERVIKNENLFEINDLSQATDILKRIIKQHDYLKENINGEVTDFLNREYNNQFLKLINIDNQS